MIFLKRFEAVGFKSFASLTRLDFDQNMIGIIGPNGSGKSNVIDAIKWVLGEQSVKSLRGKKGDDVIFYGTKEQKPHDFAQVTLYFNNQAAKLNHTATEISIMRKLYRGNGHNEYYINNELVRLKDIHDVFANTGLAKGSLGIISQGSVNWFADAKPENRRKIFEEAAGISKYMRKKEESLRQLERVQNNLNRVNDILKELQRDLKKLQTQSQQVQQFQTKKTTLTNLEVALLVHDITYANTQINELKNQLQTAQKIQKNHLPQISETKNRLLEAKEALVKTDLQIEKTNWELEQIQNKANALMLKKAVWENKITHLLNTADSKTQQVALQAKLKTKQEEYNNCLQQFQIHKQQGLELEQKLHQTQQQQQQLEKQILSLYKQCLQMETNIKNITYLMHNNPNYANGTKALIQNQSALSGILGTVLDFVKTKPEHEIAIAKALGKNVQNIIVNTKRDVERAINFLVKNQAGIATFMPIYDLKPTNMKPEHLMILQQLDGFVALGVDLVSCPKKIQPVFALLLNKIIIAQDLTQAFKLAKYTYQLYKIITLDGQIIYPFGMVKGGYVALDQNQTVFDLPNKITTLKDNLAQMQNKLITLQNNKQHQITISTQLQNQINQNQLTQGIYYHQSKQLKDEINQLESECDNQTITNNTLTSETIQTLNQTLNQLNNSQNTLIAHKNGLFKSKRDWQNKIAEDEIILEKLQEEWTNAQTVLLSFQSKLIEHQKNSEYAQLKLTNTYKLTFEYAQKTYQLPSDLSLNSARSQLARLQKELDYLPALNMTAADEYHQKNERYQTLNNQKNELDQAKEQLLKTITQIDAQAYDNFNGIISKINATLPLIFQNLFGGGSCEVAFNEPDKILTSGIDIIASLPGKKVNSLFALSGGEKTLVALAILFSILSISQFPLVILDEAESALDPVNLTRFGTIVAEFAQKTQFLIITHRIETMEKCAKLYGATMPYEGITSIYQVNLATAKKITT